MIKINTFRQRVLYFFTPQGGSRLGSDGGKADGGLKARAAGTVCLQTRAVARRRFQPFGRRHRNRSGGFCCFSTPKSREKRVFPEAAKGLREVFCCFSPPKSREKKFFGTECSRDFRKVTPGRRVFTVCSNLIQPVMRTKTLLLSLLLLFCGFAAHAQQEIFPVD